MLEEFNQAPDDDRLRAALGACCSAQAWVDALVSGRPYSDEAALAAASDAATAALDDAGVAQALAGHPRIGERVRGREGAWSRQEQSGMASAGDDVRAQLAVANAAYEEQFGHVYLVCASGRSAQELLAICLARLRNDPVSERAVVLDELAKINQLRLRKLLHSEEEA